MGHGVDVLPESSRGAAGDVHAGTQHHLHEVGRAVADGLALVELGLVDGMALAVNDAFHQDGHVVAPVGHHRAVAVDEVYERDIAGSETQGRHLFEGRCDAHAVGRLRHVVNAHLVTEFHGDAVHALCEGCLEGHGSSREMSVGIARHPLLGFPGLGGVGVGRPLIDTLRAWREALVHGLGIYEELEGGAGLTHGRHLVVLPEVEVYVAHPRPQTSRVGFYSHEAAVEELHHVAYAVHGGNIEHYGAVVAEEARGSRQVHVVVYAVRAVGETACEVAVALCALRYVLHEVGDLMMVLVLPWVLTGPVLVKALLEEAHLLHHGLLGVALYARVDGGVNLKAVGIEVEAVVAHAVDASEVAELVDVFVESRAEIWREAVVAALLHPLHTLYGQALEAVELCLRGGVAVDDYAAVVEEVLQHDVASVL